MTTTDLGPSSGPFSPCAIIPTYDNPDTIRAVVEQVRPALPVIVVDDGSADDTAVHAGEAGATVVHIEDVNERHGVAHG